MPEEREWAVPPKYLEAAEAIATDDIVEHAARRPDHVAFSRQVDGEWRPVTSTQFADQVTRLAAGLIARGIGTGDRVGLMSGTRYEWMLCDFAIWTAGAVTVPIYETSSVEQVAWILGDSGAVAVFVENAEYATAVATAQVPSVTQVWRMDDGGLDEFTVAGESVTADQVEARRRAVTADSTATIVLYVGDNRAAQRMCAQPPQSGRRDP